MQGQYSKCCQQYSLLNMMFWNKMSCVKWVHVPRDQRITCDVGHHESFICFSPSLQSLSNSVYLQPDTSTSRKEILTKQVFRLLSLSSLLFLSLLILFFKTQKHFWFFLLCVSLLSNQWPCAINSTFTVNLWFCSHPNHPLLDYLRAFRRVPLPSVSPVSSEVLSDHDFRTSHFFFFFFFLPVAQMDSSNLICELISYWYPNNQSRLNNPWKLSVYHLCLYLLL